jgi:molybdopterin-containing oxidoreductase family membrane subunit
METVMNPRQAFEIEEAAVRPMIQPGRRFGLVAGALALLVLAAFVAYGYQFTAGLAVAGYNDQAFWGVYEANLVTFIGVSYGGALVSAVLRLLHTEWRAPIARIAEAMALVTLLIGGSFAIVHLGNPLNVWRLVVSPRLSSPIVWDFYAVMTYLAATLIFLYLPLVPDLARLRDRPETSTRRRRIYGVLSLGWHGLPEQRKRLERAILVMSIVIIPLAITVHSVLAWAFSMTTRPGWHSTLFGPYFVIAALYSGVALVVVVLAGFRRAYRLQPYLGERHFVSLARIMVVLGAVYLYLTIADLLTAGYARTEDEALFVGALLQGSFAPEFWAWCVGGLLVPLVLGASLGFFSPRRQIPAAVLAAGLVVVGMGLKRLLIVIPSAELPQMGTDWGSVGLTWVPVLITLGAIAAIPLGLMLAFRFVPILAIDEMVHARQEEPEVAVRLHAEPREA